MAVSPTFNTDNQYIKYNVTVTESNNTGKKVDLLVVIKCWRTNQGYTTYGTGEALVRIAGNERIYSQDITSSQKITSSAIVLFKQTITVDSSITKPVIQARIVHSQFVSTWNDFTVSISPAIPSAPTSFNITAGYGNYVGLGDTINLSWSGASGTISGYELQYSYGNSGWTEWKTVTGTTTSVSFAGRTDINQTGAGKIIKYRVRAKNGSNASAWKESNQLIMMGGMDLKVSNAWKNGTIWIKVNGTWKRAKRVWIKVNGKWQYSK